MSETKNEINQMNFDTSDIKKTESKHIEFIYIMEATLLVNILNSK